jgi:hypothetical protein
MITKFWQQATRSLSLIAFFSACNLNQHELRIENFQHGEEILCSTHPRLIYQTKSNGQPDRFWISLKVLSDSSNPLQSRGGAGKAVITVKKDVDTPVSTELRPYSIDKKEFIEGDLLNIEKRTWKIMIIGRDGVRVNGSDYCRSDFLYMKEIKNSAI